MNVNTNRPSPRAIIWIIIGIFIAFGSATPAYAQWLNANGKIDSTHLSYANNFSFRISLKENGVDKLPSCSNSFAFINVSDDNYQAKVASLLTAASQSRTVNISYTKDNSGWCTITDFDVAF